MISTITSTAAIIGAYGLIAAGQILIYPVTQTEGGMLERIARHEFSWQVGHLLMAAGAALLVPAGFALHAALKQSSRCLATAGLVLQIIGASALIGQFALDFAFLELARAESRPMAEQIATALRHNGAVAVLYYKLADLFLLGSLAFTLAALRDRRLRWNAGLVASLGFVLVIVGEIASPLILRIGTGVLGLGFAIITLHSAKPSNARESR